ncbi:MAG: pyroglutamyl-peptidase I [Parasporobacterium sp.]|nr:pyroglutamyl-peptidase I [Parasporobacterium sp.]
MKTLLITGFEPFGGQAVNTSWEVVKHFPEKIGDFRIVTLQVPVVFERAAETVIEKANDVHPDAILCLGQAAGRTAITPEYVAINLRNASIPDNAGNEPKDAPVVEGGPDAIFATLPVRKMAEAITQASMPAEVSYSAGTYVCNDLMYGLLHHYQGTGVKVGFIHVPELEGQKISDAAQAITEAIKVLDSDNQEEVTLHPQNTDPVTLHPMTRDLCHRLFQKWENDPSIYMDMSLFKPFVYREDAVDRYFDSRQEASRILFAVMLADRPIGELQLKQIDCDRKECTLSIHMQNDAAKGRGYGTEAMRLAIRYAFEELGLDAVNADIVRKNLRSQHAAEKAGFRFVKEEGDFRYYRLEQGLK